MTKALNLYQMEDLQTFILKNCNNKQKREWHTLTNNDEALRDLVGFNGCFCVNCDTFLFLFDDDEPYQDLNNRFFQCSNSCSRYMCYPCIKDHSNDHKFTCNECQKIPKKF